jgi:hypothetical protein
MRAHQALVPLILVSTTVPGVTLARGVDEEPGRALNKPDVADRSAEYRRLVGRYEAIRPPDQWSEEGRRLRTRIGLLGEELLKEALPLGTRKATILRSLGEPVWSDTDTLLYYGKYNTWVYVLRFKRNQLAEYSHVRTCGLESGR